MKSYVINLESSVERFKNVTNEFNRLGLVVEVVRPLTATNPLSKDTGWGIGAASLRLTTIMLIENAIRDNEEMIMIFEDDSYFHDNLWRSFEKDFSFFKKNCNFNFIHLNHSAGERFSLQSKNNFIMTIDGVECCQCYIIHRRVMDMYLLYLKTYFVPIDTVTKFLHKKIGNSFVYASSPVYHKPNQFSTIREKIVNY